MLCGLCFSKRQTAKSTQQHPGELFNNPAQLPPLSRAVRPRKGCRNSGRMASPTTFFNQEQDLAPGSATEPSSSAKELSLNYAPTSASPLFFAKVPLLDRVRATLAEDSMSQSAHRAYRKCIPSAHRVRTECAQGVRRVKCYFLAS